MKKRAKKIIASSLVIGSMYPASTSALSAFKMGDENNKWIEDSKAIRSLSNEEAVVTTYKDRGDTYNQLFKLDHSQIINIENNGGHYGQSSLDRILDGDFTTFWESKQGNSDSFKNEIIFTFDDIVTLDKLVYGARRDNHLGRGFATEFEIYASQTETGDDFDFVARGSSDLVKEIVEIQFQSTDFKRLKFVFISTNNSALATACEFEFFKTDDISNQMDEMFTDSTYYELKPEYASIDKINELRNLTVGHPLENKYNHILDMAELMIGKTTPLNVEANIKLSQIAKSDNINAYNQMYRLETDRLASVTNNGGSYPGYVLTHAYDGDKDTFWETNTVNSASFKNDVVFTFNDIEEISRLIITPRQTASAKGFPFEYEIYGTLNENSSEQRLIAHGTYNGEATTADIEINFPATYFKTLTFRFIEARQARPAIGEISFYREDKVTDTINNLFEDNLALTLKDEYNDIQVINQLEQALMSHPFQDDYSNIVKMAKGMLLNTEEVFQTKVYTLSQRGHENVMRDTYRQVFAGGNVDPIGYYIMPGEEIEIYVDADEDSTLPLLTLSQVGIVDTGRPGNYRYDLVPGRNVIKAPETGPHGYAVYFTNRALESEQPYAPRVRVVSDNLQSYPLYIHGETDPQEFVNQVANHQGEDMAEVMGERFLLSATNTDAKKAYITDGYSPLDAVAGWEAFIQAFDILSGYDVNDPNPINQPPKMLYHFKGTNQDGYYANNEYVHLTGSARDLFAGKNSGWGILHEFGHQIENSTMSLNEVTNNLYSIFGQKFLTGEVQRDLSGTQKNIDKYFTYEGTKGFGGFGETYDYTLGLFERLLVLDQICNYFGYDVAYGGAARLIRENADPYITGNYQAIITAMSAATGYDLSSHFEYYNYPVTEETKAFTSQFKPLTTKIHYIPYTAYKLQEANVELFNVDTKAEIKSIVKEVDGFTLTIGTNDDNQGTVAYEIYRNGDLVGFTRTNTFKDVTEPNESYDYQIIAYDYRGNEAESELVNPHLATIHGVDSDITLKPSEVDAFNQHKLDHVTATNLINSNLTVEAVGDVQIPTVNTQETYKVVYYVMDEAGQIVSERQQVTVTNYAPIIEGVAPIILNVGATFDPLDGVTVSDVEDGVIDVQKISITSDVDSMKRGDYIVTYEVQDSDGNLTTVNRNVTVGRGDLIGDVMIEGNPHIHETLQAKLSNLPTDTLHLSYQWYLDGNPIPGATQSTLRVEEDYLNKSIYVEVADVNYNGKILSQALRIQPRSQQAPTIHGIEDITISIKEAETFNPLDGVSVTDDFDHDLQVMVTGDITKPGANSQTVSTFTYTVTDRDQNKATASRLVTVTNYAPVIHGISPIVLNIGDTFNPLDGISVSDVEDIMIDVQNVKVTSNVDMLKRGDYVVVYEVQDSDGNVTTVNRTVTVGRGDLTGDVMIEGNPTITETLKATVSNMPIDTVHLNYQWYLDGQAISGATESTLLIEDEYLNKVIHVEVSDINHTGKILSQAIQIQPRSQQAPTIHGVDDVTMGIKEVDGFDYLKGVTVTDDFDDHLQVTVSGSITKPEVNEQATSTLIYTVTDRDQNTTTVRRLITVTNYAPIIEGIDPIILNVGATFNPLDGVTVSDVEDGVIDVQTISITSDVDSMKRGDYIVTYEVQDSDGNLTTVNRTVTVGRGDLMGDVMIEGNPYINETLQAKLSNLPTDTLHLSYQWYLDGTPIPGATQSTLRVEEDYLNKSIYVEVADVNYNGKILSQALRIQPRSQQAPTIHGIEDITISIKEAETFNPLAGVSVTDDFDHDLQVVVTGDITKPGANSQTVSTFTYTVTDRDQNKATVSRLVTVTNYAPTFEGLNKVTIEAGQSFDVLNGVKAIDLEDGEISNIIVEGDIDTQQLGEQIITYSVTDSDGNTTIKKRIIEVTQRSEAVENSVVFKRFVPLNDEHFMTLLNDILAYSDEARIINVSQEQGFSIYRMRLNKDPLLMIEIKVDDSFIHAADILNLFETEEDNMTEPPVSKEDDDFNTITKPSPSNPDLQIPEVTDSDHKNPLSPPEVVEDHEDLKADTFDSNLNTVTGLNKVGLFVAGVTIILTGGLSLLRKNNRKDK